MTLAVERLTSWIAVHLQSTAAYTYTERVYYAAHQGNVEDEGTNTAAKGHAAEQVVVRQASSSCESPTPQTADVASDTTLEASSVWYDCNEDFGLEGDAVVQDSGDAVVTAGGLLQQAYAALPQQLTTIVKQYKQVTASI